jgi:hypothetical protein
MCYVFELPIYSMSKEEYKKRQSKLLKAKADELNLTENNPNYYQVIGILEDNYCPDWEYNQIVGYIKFYFQNYTLMGDFWMIQQNRRKLAIGKKNFKYVICYPEWGVYSLNKLNNNEINQLFIEKIPNDLTGFLKKYYVDLSFLIKFGKYINWKDFIK